MAHPLTIFIQFDWKLVTCQHVYFFCLEFLNLFSWILTNSKMLPKSNKQKNDMAIATPLAIWGWMATFLWPWSRVAYPPPSSWIGGGRPPPRGQRGWFQPSKKCASQFGNYTKIVTHFVEKVFHSLDFPIWTAFTIWTLLLGCSFVLWLINPITRFPIFD